MSQGEVFKALADPTRREILRLLASGERSAGELAERFEMSKPSVSHHFTVLKAADLVGSRRQGQQVIYWLNTTVLQDVLAWVWDFLPAAARTSADRREDRSTDAAS